ncbi:hypothetical protein [Pedobacter miscanthi]|uniref:Redox-active disulfide protein 2 n=1 Tax=Pedobacter miscanthi TaxID=2259170 RepID=A0A366KT31_9SPHI|nr:hypothetical protein [Pedobacter miscanthi]RBQ04274.1 hypothetical protein DRW42_18920 [Pedobacter miscanthi]
MTYNNPNELSNEELLKTEKKLKVVLSIVIAIFILSFAVIFLMNKSYPHYAGFIIPMILISPIYFNFRSLSNIKKELKLRNLDL